MMPVLVKNAYKGLLVIGDPHLEARIPGFRKDEYPRVILEKLRWAFQYAADESLLPLITGDLFHLPRNNPNWLLVEVLQLFDRELCFIYGNHDVHENTLTDDDSISILVEAGRGHLLGNDCQVAVTVNGRQVVVGGTPWGQRIPQSYEKPDAETLVIWLTHHDLIVPGYEEKGWFRPRGLPGIDIVINGHIHRCLETVYKDPTVWLTPGNISRRARSDATRMHVPSVFRIDVEPDRWASYHVEVPHSPYDEVFYEAVLDGPVAENASGFVTGLAELQARRTQTGEGLRSFLKKNLDQFEPDVAEEIRQLAREVIIDDESTAEPADN